MEETVLLTGGTHSEIHIGPEETITDVCMPPNHTLNGTSEFSDADDENSYTLLPETVWVKIMRCLDLHDRARVAQTCHILNAVFNHPSLWHTVSIHLLAAEERIKYGIPGSDMADHYVQMINRFGRYFQNLTLMFIGYFYGMKENCRKVLNCLSSRCRLEKLTLHVGILRTKGDLYRVPVQQPLSEDLDALAGLVRHSFRLKSFSLKSWPFYHNWKGINILEVLCGNRRIHGLLNDLNLFSETADSANWTTQNPLLVSPHETMAVISTFNCLTTLSLRLCMLDDDVVGELSKPERCKLLNFHILVTYLKQNKDVQIPVIQRRTWKNLVKHSPRLRVEFTFQTRMPHVERCELLKTEIPVSALFFMEFSNVTSCDLTSFRDKYHNSLRKIISFTFDTDVGADEALIEMTEECKLLVDICYCGQTKHTIVAKLAQLRGHSWNRFEIEGKHISFIDDFIETDEVVSRNEEGDLFLTSIHRKTLEASFSESEALEALEKDVSSVLGREWRAITKIS